MFSLLLSDVVGLPGLFSSPFMSPLVKVVLIKRVVVIMRMVGIRIRVIIMREQNDEDEAEFQRILSINNKKNIGLTCCI